MKVWSLMLIQLLLLTEIIIGVVLLLVKLTVKTVAIEVVDAKAQEN